MTLEQRIIRLKTVLARTGLSRSTIYRMIGEGTFPRQVRIGIQATGWYESEVDQWISDPASYRQAA
ncbi:prophage regulatory protein [Sphingopyxis sp. OAS728]|uniref:helix-turn-helix transcriptional regulator n=1 Tax=Sphingopyxis sp. OAS728 TaxID=2663823 RepID=UPI00178AB35B|nr:AlpA family transcriptional regulator [Sphingopyxis sp. OAS728]MBE1527877.1 prophage regulatory protein [Sphingopyxis sp. OAS728]